MKVNLTSESIKYGTIGGLLFMLIHILAWIIGASTYASVILVETFVPYLFVGFLLAAFQVRKQNGGYLSFAEQLKFVFLAYIIVALIEAITNYVLFNVLDKELSIKVFEITREKTLRFMQKMDAPKAEIDKAIKQMDADKKETTFKTVFLGLGISLIWYFVKSMLIAIIAKKEPKIDFESTI